MRVPDLRSVAALILGAGLVAALAGPVPAGAQCGMMGGGGHDHSAAQRSRDAKSAGSDRKLRQGIDRVLADERGRALLTDALLEDDAFMEGLLRRMATNPERRTLAARLLAEPPSGRVHPADAPAAPAPAAYACPMHPDLTSARPGDCPKCGMPLVRKEQGRP